jgi:hypothetical protein
MGKGARLKRQRRPNGNSQSSSEKMAAKFPELGLKLHPSHRSCGRAVDTFDDVLLGARKIEAHPPCGGCTACCRAGYDVTLTPEEAGRFPHILDDDGTPMLRKQPDGMTCEMLIGGQCSIYADRPLTCRVYDCRIFALSGIFPERLFQTDYVPFRVMHESREDKICEMACRISAIQESSKANGAEEIALKAIVHALDFREVAAHIVDQIEESPELQASIVKALGQMESYAASHGTV